MSNYNNFNLEFLRVAILNFLQWNDRNGIYTDNNRIKEEYEPLNFKESLQYFIECILNLRDFNIDAYEVEIDNFINMQVIRNCLRLVIEKDYSTICKIEYLDILSLTLNQMEILNIDKDIAEFESMKKFYYDSIERRISNTYNSRKEGL